MDNKHIGSNLDDFLKEENIEIKTSEIKKRLERSNMLDSFIKLYDDMFLNLSSIESFSLVSEINSSGTTGPYLKIRAKSGKNYCVEDYKEVYKNLLEKVVFSY